MSKNLLEKWWYRLLKVSYILVFLGTISLSFGIVFSDKKPNTNYYRSTYGVKCSTGYKIGSFPSKELNGNFYGKSLAFLDFKDETGVKITRAICANYDTYSKLSSEEDKANWFSSILNNKIENIPNINNYEIVFDNKSVNGNWFGFIGYLVLSMIIPVIVFIAIRYLFFYVLLGQHKYVFNEIKRKKMVS